MLISVTFRFIGGATDPNQPLSYGLRRLQYLIFAETEKRRSCFVKLASTLALKIFDDGIGNI